MREKGNARREKSPLTACGGCAMMISQRLAATNPLSDLFFRPIATPHLRGQFLYHRLAFANYMTTNKEALCSVILAPLLSPCALRSWRG